MRSATRAFARIIDKFCQDCNVRVHMVTFLEAVARPGWVGLKVSGRIDAFNVRNIIQTIEDAARSSHSIGLDLSECEFVNLQMLIFLSAINRQLGRNGGELGLVRPNHNVRRQIEIFLGAKSLRVYDSIHDLQNGYSAQPRAEFRNLPVESLHS